MESRNMLSSFEPSGQSVERKGCRNATTTRSLIENAPEADCSEGREHIAEIADGKLKHGESPFGVREDRGDSFLAYPSRLFVPRLG